jgi:hypothetical protein
MPSRELRPPKNEGLVTLLAGNGAVTVERACLHYQIFFQRYCNLPLLKTTNKKILASVRLLNEKKSVHNMCVQKRNPARKKAATTPSNI